MAVVINVAQVLDRAREPQHVAQRHALPKPMPERVGEVVARDDLEVTGRLGARDFHEAIEGERGSVGLEQRRVDLRIAVGVGNDFELPRLALHADLDPLLQWQLVGRRVAALNVVELTGLSDATAASFAHRPDFFLRRLCCFHGRGCDCDCLGRDNCGRSGGQRGACGAEE